jgi:5-methylcytosine-specific restriction enzyme A
MPSRSPRPCAVPGCPNLVYESGVSRCAEHQKQYEREHDARRGSSSQRGYDREWRIRRARFLRDNPRCVLCGAPATVAHHVIRKGAGGPDDEVNLVALCAACHSKHHAQTGESWSKKK